MVYCEGNLSGTVLVKGHGFFSGKHSWRVTLVEKHGDVCYFAGVCSASDVDVQLMPPSSAFLGVSGGGSVYPKGSGFHGADLETAGNAWEMDLDCDAGTLQVKVTTKRIEITIPF